MIYIKKKSWFKKSLNVVFRKRDIQSGNFCKFLKRFILLFLFILIVLYISFICLIPKYIKEDNVELFLNSYFSKNTNLIFDIDNLKVSPNYKLDVNIKADEFKLKYSKDKDFLIIDKVNIDLNILSLFFGYVDFLKIKI